MCAPGQEQAQALSWDVGMNVGGLGLRKTARGDGSGSQITT